MTTSLARRFGLARHALLGAAIGLAFAAAPAAAQDASVYVSSFGWTTSNGDELVWTDPYQKLAASVLNGGGIGGGKTDEDESNGYNQTIGFASLSNATASYSAGAAGDQTFYLTASTTPGGYPFGTPRHAAESTGSNSGFFSMENAGTVTFNIGYTLGVNKANGNPIADFGAAFLSFAASGDGTSGGNLSATLESFANLSGMATRSGTFSLTVSLLAGQLGFYELNGRAESFATAVTPIPEPETWALMLAGLAGLGAVAKRRRTATA